MTYEELYKAGDLLAQTGFAGIKRAADGFVILLTCQQENISLMTFQRKFHYMKGRFTATAHSLLDNFCSRGGSFELHERSENCAKITLKKGEISQTFEIRWENLLKEPFVYEGSESEVIAALAAGKKPKIKAKYATPRARQQMLWARLISDSVATIDPGARTAYTPEEVEDFTADKSDQAPPAVLPVEEAKQPEATETDFTVCPIRTKKVDFWGKRFSDISTSILEKLLTCEKPEITEKHKEEIKKVLYGRVDWSTDYKQA